MRRLGRSGVKRRVYRSKWEKGLLIKERLPRNMDQFGWCNCWVCDGRGSFNIRIGKSKTYTCGYSIRPTFSVGLKRSDKNF